MAEIKQIKVGSTTYDIRDTSKAPLASPALTGTPTAPTAANGTNTTQIATTAFVQNAFKANDAMIFKGTIGSSGATVTALPATHYQGWTYKVATAGSYAGQNCEIGDTIMCVTDGTSANNAHWTVIQSNIDGAVTGPASAVDTRVAVFNGTSGKVIKDSGFTISKSVPSDAKFTDTTYSNGNGISLSGTTFSASFPTSGTPSALGTASNGSSNNVARSDHVHAKPSYGNITTAGAITATQEIADGDKIVIVDSSNSSKLTGSTITFDGSTATKALTQKGTWETFNNYSLPTASSSTKGGVKVGTGLSISSEVLSNSGVRSIATGTSNGTISVNTNGTSANVAVKGLGSAAYIDDAPKDGKYYARKDNAWTIVADSSGSTTSTIPWGNITGTLSNQTDLQTALNGKAASSHTHSYLPLSGGTITGTIYVKNADADVTVAPSTTLERIVGFNDKNSKLFAYMSGLLSASTSSLYLCARHYKSDSSRVDNYLRLLSAPDGTKTVEVSEPAAWRTALGLGTAATTASTAYATSSHDHSKGTVKPNCIEFNPTSNTAAHGGFIDFHYNQSTADYTSRIIEQTSGVLSVVGGLNVSGTVTLTKTTDAAATTNNSPALIVGGAATAAHLEFDADEIMAKSNGTTASPLYLNWNGGKVSVGGGGFQSNGDITLYRETTTSADTPAALKFSIKDTTTGQTYNGAGLYAYQDHGATTYGANVVLSPGGNVFLGSGESPSSHYALKVGDTGEDTYITSDNVQHIQANGNTIANRVGMQLTTGHAIVPEKADVATNNVGSIGTSTYKWNAMYATTFYGALSGNASTASGSVCNELTNQNLNDYKTNNATWYYGVGGNTVSNKPSGTTSFGLLVFREAGGYYKQIFFATGEGAIYSRYYGDNTWGAWKEWKLTDTKYTASTITIGSASAGTAIAADDITAWSAGSLPSASVSDGVLTMGMGSLPSLSYTARSIPNISVANKTVATGITAS